MALKPCKGCGNAVDATAKACPGCGKPWPVGFVGGTKIGLLAFAAVVFGVAIVAGLNSRSKDGAVAVKAVSPAPPETVRPQPDEPRPVDGPQFVVSVAVFNGDSLFECVDIEAINASDVSALAEKAWKGMSGNKQNKGTTLTRLGASCATQFSDRRPFAVCTLPTGSVNGSAAGTTVATKINTRSLTFSFSDVFKSDSLLKDCLKAGGKWESMARDSQEFREAQMRFTLDDMQARHRKVQRDLERSADLLTP